MLRRMPSAKPSAPVRLPVMAHRASATSRISLWKAPASSMHRPPWAWSRAKSRMACSGRMTWRCSTSKAALASPRARHSPTNWLISSVRTRLSDSPCIRATALFMASSTPSLAASRAAAVSGVAAAPSGRAASTRPRRRSHSPRTVANWSRTGALGGGSSPVGPSGFRVSGATPPSMNAARVASKTRNWLAMDWRNAAGPPCSRDSASLVIFWLSMR